MIWPFDWLDRAGYRWLTSLCHLWAHTRTLPGKREIVSRVLMLCYCFVKSCIFFCSFTRKIYQGYTPVFLVICLNQSSRWWDTDLLSSMYHRRLPMYRCCELARLLANQRHALKRDKWWYLESSQSDCDMILLCWQQHENDSRKD